jgi:hypothetical protein
VVVADLEAADLVAADSGEAVADLVVADLVAVDLVAAVADLVAAVVDSGEGGSQFAYP